MTERVMMTELVTKRAAELPQKWQSAYIRAHTTGSRTAAINAMCHACVGYEQVSALIGGCTDALCPLYKFRPYRGKSESSRPKKCMVPSPQAGHEAQ